MICNIPVKHALLGKRHLVFGNHYISGSRGAVQSLLNQLLKTYLCYKIVNFKLQMRRAKEIAR